MVKVNVKVGKGHTIIISRDKKGEPQKWIREYYELESVVNYEGQDQREMQAARDDLLHTIDLWLASSESQALRTKEVVSQPSETQAPSQAVSVDEVQKSLQKYADKIEVITQGAGLDIIVKPTGYLGKDFKPIANIVRTQFNGEYVEVQEDKKKSYFRIPREKPAEAPPETPRPEKPTEPPGIDPDELEGLPWETYTTKQPSKIGEAGWIFSDLPQASSLLDLTNREGPNVPVMMGDGTTFLVSLSKDGKFLQRRPVTR